MNIWWVSLGLALISYTCSVHSQTCQRHYHCEDEKCCRGSRCTICRCKERTDCPSGQLCLLNNCVRIRRPQPCGIFFGPRCRTTPYSSSPAPTSAPYTHLNNDRFSDICVRDSDCEGSSVCKGGQCRGQDGGVFASSGSIIITIICLVVLATTLLFLCHMYRRARKPPGAVATQNADTTRATGHEMAEMQPGNAVSNGAAVIEVEDDSLRPLPVGAPPPYTPFFLPEINAVYDNGGTVIEDDEDSSVLHPGAPPPYSSLELEGQQNISHEPEQAPPSYDEAVRNSATT